MHIKILGSGCNNCIKLAENAKKAISEYGIDATVEKVEDIEAIMAYGVMRTPALVIDEKVKSMGKVLSTKQIKAFL